MIGGVGKVYLKIRSAKVLGIRSVVFVHDLLWTIAAIAAAYWLRFNFEAIPADKLDSLYDLLLFSVPAHAAAFLLFGCYRGVWRFASIPDFLRISAAVVTGLLASVLALFLYNRLADVPRTVVVLYPILLVAGVAGARVLYRAIIDHGLRIEFDSRPRALVVGAGRAGEMLVRDLLRNGPYRPVCILDDDEHKRGQELHGIRVRGPINELDAFARHYRADHVLIAIPSAGGKLLERIVSRAIDTGLEVATLPAALTEFEAPGSWGQKLRPLTVEDLLGREQVDLDDAEICEVIGDHVVMVTGGGGSIGSEVCRQVAAHEPRRLVIFDNSEFNLYSIESELRASFPALDIKAVLGNVADPLRVDGCMAQNGVDMVFHAAAYKHVPLVEYNPCEAARNNVLGTRTVADAAIRNNVRKFLLISTDKVVNPTSVMGATKRAAELYCQSLGSRSGTQFITTRFGNVLGSCGSVVPLFEAQIAAGGPVTVTDPDVTRYFMTINEAVGLILQASAIGHGGEIFVMDMGKPVPIVELAEKMIRLYGKVPGRDIVIEYTGLRPGEKLHEALFYEQEELVGTSHPKLLLANCFPASQQWLEGEFHALDKVIAVGDAQACIECLQRLVPDFLPYSRDQVILPAEDEVVAPLRLVK